jgi:UDP-N-acetylglucosamine 2-epimerase (non-hydrolysing)
MAVRHSARRVSIVIGTRPEAIKLCPLALAMRARPELVTSVCVTGQHRQLLDEALAAFAVAPDADLNVMCPNQSLSDLTSRTIAAMDKYLEISRPDLVIVQGDTTSAFCAALCAFHRKLPVGHVEAGLRTHDKGSPFPEEINRMLTTRLADLHFAPTETARRNLLHESVPAENIFVTGNTVIDALLFAVERVQANPPTIEGLPPSLQPRPRREANDEPPMVLVTGHRRESFGSGLENLCRAIAILAERFPESHFVYPVHLNPNVREPVHRLLDGVAPNTVHLIDPLGYLPFVAMMDRATLVLTDSGGVQEEAPSLGKPVLVLRDATERPETVGTGAARLVGTGVEAIVDGVTTLLTDGRARAAMARAVNPFGDGKACERILDAIMRYLYGEDEVTGSPRRPHWQARDFSLPPTK